MSDIRRIPVKDIQPFKDQPRSYFDLQALQELADSIKTHGQYTPAWVVELPREEPAYFVPVVTTESYRTLPKQLPPPKYELVAGERRWRACQLVGIETLLCEVRTYATQEERYMASVMENFGRKDCTTMETARSVGRLLKECEGDFERVASVFARSVVWVRQIHMLNRLEPEVAAMLEPPDAKLTTQIGVSLANLQPEVQIRLAREIAGRGLKFKAAQAFVRNSTTDAQRVVNRGGRRAPSKDLELLKTLLKTVGPQAQAIMDLGTERLSAVFKHRDPKDLKVLIAVLQKRIKQIQELEEVLSGIERDANAGRGVSASS